MTHILLRLKRGQNDPNPYPVRCKRRRKRPRPDGDEWYTWGRVHDKQPGRTSDLLPRDYVDSLERDEKRRWRWSLRRKLKGICNAVRFIWEVMPFFVDYDAYYPYGRFVAFSTDQRRADGLAAIKSIALLADRIRDDREHFRDYLGMDDDCFNWWLRGLNAARTSIMSLVMMDVG